MVFDPFTAAITVATLVLTEAVKVPGKKLGEVSLDKAGALASLIKSKLPGKPLAIAPATEQPIDVGQASLEISEAAKDHPDVAQAVQELAAAVQNDDSEVAREIRAKAKTHDLPVSSVINNTKLAEKIGIVIQGGSNPITIEQL